MQAGRPYSSIKGDSLPGAITLSLPVCVNPLSKERSPKTHLHFESGRARVETLSQTSKLSG